MGSDLYDNGNIIGITIGFQIGIYWNCIEYMIHVRMNTLALTGIKIGIRNTGLPSDVCW